MSSSVTWGMVNLVPSNRSSETKTSLGRPARIYCYLDFFVAKRSNLKCNFPCYDICATEGEGSVPLTSMC
jgi:hypothetical protein